MHNLIAYIPTLNQRHLDWFENHPGSTLFLISQEEAENLLPRLSRNIVAIPTILMVRMINSQRLVARAQVWPAVSPYVPLPEWERWILPDEDISHLFADKYLLPRGSDVSFEMIWARYDMTAIIRDQPVIPDVEISTSDFDRGFMDRAVAASGQSPDWWRQIGAVALLRTGEVVPSKHNVHMPNEYETYIFGDPRLAVEAGQPGKYTAIHSEEGIITHCARHGLALEGSSVYVTTFPCERCARQMADVGVGAVFFRDGYSSLNAQDVLRANGVEIIQVRNDPVSA